MTIPQTGGTPGGPTPMIFLHPTYPIGGGGGGGGAARTGGANNISSFVPFLENGGFQATAYLLFIPTETITGSNAYIGTFSPGSYDDPVDGSTYSFRQEDVIPNRVPTVRRVVITYRNLGVCTLTVTVGAINDLGVAVIDSQTQQIGDTSADASLRTAFFDLTVTGFRPQLTISRAAGGGPFSIIRASMIGEVEDATL